MARNTRPVGPLSRQIAIEVRAARGRKKMTQEDLARLAEIPVSTLAKIERFESVLDVEQLGRIAQAFGLSMDVFVRRSQDSAALYRSDGSLNPAEISGIPESDSHIDELANRENSPDAE